MSTGEAPAKLLLVGEHAVVHGRVAFALPFPALRARAQHRRQDPRSEPRMAAHHDVFQDAEILEDLQVLEGAGHAQADAPVRRQAFYGLAAKCHAAARGTQQARNDVEQRALAGPIGPDQAFYLAAAHIEGGSDSYQPLVYNYTNFIYNAAAVKQAPKSFADLLDPKFKGKIQYSTPGQAGDGTAVMLLVNHAFGGKDAGFEFMKKLQDNNVGPSASTGKLTALVNKSELFVANGDLQMNMVQMKDNPNIRVFWPAGPDGVRTALSLPYYVGLVTGAPDSNNGKKLIEFLLSRKAQSTVSSVAYGLPVRKDVTPTDANYKSFHEAMHGVKIWTPDWNVVLQELPADVARWRQVTGS